MIGSGENPGVGQNAGVGLLVSMVVLFTTAPLLEGSPGGRAIEAAVLTLVMIFAVFAVGGQKGTLLLTLVLLAPAVAGKWMNLMHPEHFGAPLYLLPMIVFLGHVAHILIRYLLHAPQVNANVLCAGVASFLVLGLVWAPVYTLVARLAPGSFAFNGHPGGEPMEGFNALYFSMITLCTVGYGDLVPVSKVARMLAVLEATAGMFYMAILISRLVAVYSANERRAGS